ncbi:hypothetical protein OSTOST_20434 [Ostertagia ostertagi]
MWNEEVTFSGSAHGFMEEVVHGDVVDMGSRVGLFVVFSLMPFATSSVGHPLFLAFYAAFHRPLWAISLLSFLYLSHHGSFAGACYFNLAHLFTTIEAHMDRSRFHRTDYTLLFLIYAAVSASTLAYLVALLIDIFLTRPIRCLLHREHLYRYRSAQTS